MKLAATSTLVFDVPTPTPMVLLLRPRSGAGQWITQEAYRFTPELFAEEYTDTYGNLCQRIVAPLGRFEIQVNVVVVVADQIDTAPGAAFTPPQELPAVTLPYLLPSRYCQSDDSELAELARTIVGDAVPGYDQVATIERWIATNITYTYGTSGTSTSSLETLAQQTGVCRDFAHLGMALCRTLNIPARMVVGYLYQLDPMDQHAWFEAFVGGRWYVFDATQPEPRGGRITIAYGRDAADVALATQFGPARLQELRVQVERVAQAPTA